MGNQCSGGLKNSEQCVKSDLTALLCQVVAEDSIGYTTAYRVSSVRLHAIKRGMSQVRSACENWPQILHMGMLTTKPSHVSICEIAEYIGYNLQNVFKIGHVMALCTYVTDFCVIKMCKNELIDVYATMDSLVSFLVDKNLDMCVEFLKHLDSWPLMEM